MFCIKLQGIYILKNIVDNKVYVGQSKNIYNRWNAHEEELNMGIHCNNHLQNAWNKYGGENFEFSVLEIVNNEYNLTNCEEYWMDFVYDSRKNGYNIRHALNTRPLSEETKWKIGMKTKERFKDPANNPMHGKTHTVESRKKISDNNKGKHIGEKNAFYGKKHSDLSKQKMSEANIGRKFSEESLKRMSEASKGRTPFNKKDISTDTLNLIANKLNKGENLACISRELNLSYKILIRVRKELYKDKKISDSAFGYKNSNTIIFSQKDKFEILNRLIKGDTLTSIGKSFNCSYHTIRKVKNEFIKEGKL